MLRAQGVEGNRINSPFEGARGMFMGLRAQGVDGNLI